MWLMLSCTCTQKETVLLFAFLPPAQRFLFKYLLLCVHIPAIPLVGRWLHLTTRLILSDWLTVFFLINAAASTNTWEEKEIFYWKKMFFSIERYLEWALVGWWIKIKIIILVLILLLLRRLMLTAFMCKKKLNKDRCFHKDWRSWFSAFLYQATIESIFSF